MIFLKKKKSLTSLNGLCFFTKYSLILLAQFFPMRTFIFAIGKGWCRNLLFWVLCNFRDNAVDKCLYFP